MASPSVTPLQIVIEAVQYTRGLDPVTIQFANATRAGLFGDGAVYTTTQTALVARIDPAIATTVGPRWSDPEVEADLLAYFASNGITAVIADAVLTATGQGQ